jgi:hypothetical protein
MAFLSGIFGSPKIRNQEENIRFAGLPTKTLEDLQMLIQENNATIDSFQIEIDQINILGEKYSSQNKTKLNLMLQNALLKQTRINKEYNQLKEMQKNRDEWQRRAYQQSQNVNFNQQYGRINKQQQLGLEIVGKSTNTDCYFLVPRTTQPPALPTQPKIELDVVGKSTNADHYYSGQRQSSGRALRPTTDTQGKANTQLDPKFTFKQPRRKLKKLSVSLW